MNSSKNEIVGSHLISFEDHLDFQYGKKGTPEREEFEEGFEAFKLGVIKKIRTNDLRFIRPDLK
jgi:hypothetical protein